MAAKRSLTETRSLRDQIFRNAPGLEAMEALFDTIGDVLFCVKDCERRYITANDSFVRRAGLQNRTQLIGRTARQIFPAILAAGYEQQDDEVFSKGATLKDRIELITHPDGEMGWFVSHKTPVRNVSGSVIALAGVSRDLGTSATKDGNLGVLSELIDTIHRDYASALRIETLAQKSGLSWSQFQRRVRNITGLTPRNLLTKTRVEAAAQALLNTTDPLSVIAIDCGFYDQAAFSRQFRFATGLTPSEYRKAFDQNNK